MKKHLLMLVAAVIATTMSLNARVVLIDEGFENGISEEVWTQQFIPADAPMPWAVEDEADGLSHPSTVVQGTKRAFLRNTTGETLGYTTRLISKVMDLRPTKVYMPELSFWYANPAWGADRDTLRVLYRTDTLSGWKQMAEFSTSGSDWQRVKLSLPEVGKVYQIAFEGKDNLGRGIVLDSIKLQSAPECTVPHDLMATNKGAGKVNLSWVASFDADYFELVVTKDTIDPDRLDEIETNTPEKIIYHGLVETKKKDLVLEAGEFYLAYVRSLCEEENSAWSSELTEGAPFGFKVRTVKQIPFTENFNYPSGQYRDVDWSWGSNTGKTNPFVNSSLAGKVRANYSPDTTAVVVFSGGAYDELTTVLPADRYAYLVTPALMDSANDQFKVNQLQVHFWSTVYTFTGRQYGRSIMVGVMDDPDDITSFVPVDTISVWGNKTFQENIVDLGSYNGNGAYVAFVSDFDRPNLFYIDNLTIEYRKQVNKVTTITVNPRDTYATISWEGNASSYNVLITNAEVNPANPAAEAIVDQATVTTNSYRCEALAANHSWNRPYYVYVKAQGTDWSYRYPFVTIAPQREIPYSYGFESGSTPIFQIGAKQYAEGIGIFGNSGSYPSIETSSTKSYVGSGYLYLSQMGGKDSWITLPMVEDLANTQVKLYLSGYETPNQAHASVGVMTNPMDINSYTKVADFHLNAGGYTRCYANFENYHGADGVIAVVWEDVANMSMFTNNYIDELIVEELSSCVPPTDIELQIAPDSIVVTWEESDLSDEWELFISRIPLKESDRMGKTLEEIAVMGGVTKAELLTWTTSGTNPQFGIGGLNPHTNYYLYVRATCDPTWWTEMAFSTPCHDEEFPFKETFEAYNAGGTSAGCWELADYQGVGYPKIVSAGTKTLNLCSSGTTHRSMAIMPKVNGALENMMLTFSARTADGAATSTGVLYIGTMEDINIQSTFVPFDTIYISGSDFKKERFILSNYDLAYDNIAITTGIGSLKMNSDVLIDNVELRDPSCIDAYDFVQTNSAPHSFDLVWSGVSDNDMWQLKVLTSNVSINAVMNGTYKESLAVVNDTLVNGNQFSLSGLQALKNYYVYVRSLCGDSAWVMAPVKTSCELLDPNKVNKETFESYVTGAGFVPDCWTVGNGYPGASSSYIPYIYSSSTYSFSGSNSFRMYGYSSYSPAYIVSPEILCDSLNQVAVTFYMYASTSYSWVCGVMTDPNDLSTFVVLDSVQGTSDSRLYTYDLSETTVAIPASAKYFAWRTPYGTSSNYAYLDDVSFISVACPLTKPSYSDLTTESVRISSGLRTSDRWIVMITNTPISDANLAKDDYVVPSYQMVYRDTISRRSHEIFGLSPQTKYYVYTATLCDSVTMSQWSSLEFITPCQALTPEELGTITFSDKDGYETGSGGEIPCWTVGSKTQTASASYIPYINNSATYKHDGHNYLQLYDYVYGTSTYNVGAYAIMPELNVDSIKKYQVTFWGRSNTSTSANNQLIVGIISDPSDLSTFVPVDTLILSKSSWDPYSVGFERYVGDYMGEMGRNIMFLSDFGVTNYAYISDISVELIPRCRSIQSFSVDSVGETAAIVSWKGYQDTYRMMVSNKALTEEQKPVYHYLIDTIVNHSDEVRITGLNPTTNYYVYAQGFCDEGERTAISVTYAAFQTTCPTEGGSPIPFYDDFESYEVSEKQPGCWQMLWKTSRPSLFDVRTVSSNGTKAINIYSSSYMVFPSVDADLSDLKLSFDGRSYGGSSATKMYIGVMADPMDPTTFVLLETFDLLTGTDFTHCTMELGNYELPYDYLVVTSGISGITPSVYDVYFDNAALEYVSTCNAPKLKLSVASYETAELRLTPSKAEDTQWEYVCLTEAEYSNIGDITRYLNDTQTRRVTIDSTHIVLTGLTRATTYYVYARTICEDGIPSSWTRNPLKFSTQFYFEESYFFGFEKNSELSQRSPYSESDNYYIHPALKADKDSLGTASQSYMYYPYCREDDDTIRYARTGSGALVMHAYKNLHGAYVIFPAINMPKDRSFEFRVRPGDIIKRNGSSTWIPNYTEDGMLEIGLVDKGKDFDTYQRIASVHINKLSATATASAKNNWQYKYYNLDLDSATVATKQVVFHMPKQEADSVYLYIDDVKMDATKGFSLVSLKKIIANGTGALIEWDNIGGPWNLSIATATGTVIANYTALTGTSQLVEGLMPSTDYVATLTAANAPSNSYIKTDKLAFTTLCETMQPNANGTDFVWDFDNEDEWNANDVLAGDAYDALYSKPACFQVGITYADPANGYQWLIQRNGYEYAGPMMSYNASRHFETGLNNSNSLRVHTTDDKFNSYIVLPELNCSFDTMMLEFYGRCFANYDQTYSYSGQIVDVTYLNSAYSQSIVVGTLTDPNDFSTLQILDTLTYTQTDLTNLDNVNDDPAGLRYWEFMQMPLDAAQGKYIVLFQPAPGLFFLDNLAVKPIGNTMFAPSNPQTTNITENGAQLSWNVRQPQFSTVVVVIDQISGAEVLRDTVSGTQYVLTGLQASKMYQWYAYQTDGVNNSAASKLLSFATECVTVTPAYTCGFEPEEGWKAIEEQKSHSQMLCWTYGDAAQGVWTNVNYDPYNQANTKDFSYSYSGSHAIMMRATYSTRTTYQPYIAMPAMDPATYDTLQVNFWMRPAYISATTDSVLLSYTGSTYSKSVIVGTMTDPTDASTFVAIDTLTYDGTLSVADKAMPGNDYLFQQMKVELAGATGPYIAFMTSFFEKGSRTQKTGDYIWIDDISFEHKQECKNPTEMTELQIGTYHAVLEWNGIDSAGAYLVQVSTDPFFSKEEDLVFNEEVYSNTCTVKGLEPLTSYVWRVKAICGERWGESSFSQKATFKTSRSPYFLEEFSTTVSANEWTFSKTHADNVLDTTGTIVRGVDNQGFSRKTDNKGLEGPHYASTGYNANYNWMITPNFYLPEEDSVHFSMDLAVTACNTAHLITSNAITNNDVKDDYYFMIIVSDDGGNTWKSENILAKWQNTNPEGMQLRDIPATGMKVRYSLAGYAGKNIRIGLYREARTVSNTGIAIHVDNVRLGYFDKTVDYESACQYEEVTVGTIHLSGDETQPGIHAYPVCFYATDAEAKAGKRDSVQQLEIEVFPAQETFLADTICEGDTYTDYNFMPKTVTGTYRRKLHTVITGCDSIVTLNLYVKERRYAKDEITTLCPGETYTWRENVYNRAGIYRDTLVSSIGCDSIMTLVITNAGASVDTLYDSAHIDIEELPYTYFNAEHPYAAGQDPIFYPVGTAKGTYMNVVRVEGAGQCANILIFTLHITDRHEGMDAIYDERGSARKVIIGDRMYIILNDEWYNAAGQKVANPMN